MNVGDKCPQCGGDLERDEADVGVGVIYGPAGCPACFWVEPESDLLAGLRRSRVHEDEAPQKEEGKE
jgi:hypothetical protein